MIGDRLTIIVLPQGDLLSPIVAIAETGDYLSLAGGPVKLEYTADTAVIRCYDSSQTDT